MNINKHQTQFDRKSRAERDTTGMMKIILVFIALILFLGLIFFLTPLKQIV